MKKLKEYQFFDNRWYMYLKKNIFKIGISLFIFNYFMQLSYNLIRFTRMFFGLKINK